MFPLELTSGYKGKEKIMIAVTDSGYSHCMIEGLNLEDYTQEGVTMEGYSLENAMQKLFKYITGTNYSVAHAQIPDSVELGENQIFRVVALTSDSVSRGIQNSVTSQIDSHKTVTSIMGTYLRYKPKE